MFLQTLVQLNILILATPALAGWTLMPPAHPGAVRAACVVWQFRSAETAAPKVDQAQISQPRPTSQPQTLHHSHFVKPSIAKLVNEAPTFTNVAAAALISFHPFPYATRAP